MNQLALSPLRHTAEEPLLEILALDPGPEQTAWCLYSAAAGVVDAGIDPNGRILKRLRDVEVVVAPSLVIESVESYGMPVGKEVFRTCYWIGRFAGCYPWPAVLLPRREVKLALCGTSRAKDSNVRQAVIDELGEPPTKKRPNPRYGSCRPRRDIWSAIAIALALSRLNSEGRAGDLEVLGGEE